MIYELEIKKHFSALYQWELVRFPNQIGDGCATDLDAVLLAPVRRGHVQASDKLAITVGGVAVGIYPAPAGDNDAAQIARDIAAILSF